MDETDAFDERDALAAEYAVGVIDAGGRAEAERLLASDASFMALVAEWRARIDPLVETVAPVVPRPGNWDIINSRLDGAPERRVGTLESRAGSSIWSSLGFWRGMSFAASAAAVALLALVLQPAPVATVIPAANPAPAAPVAGTMFAAAVSAENGAALIAAAIDTASGELVITPTQGFKNATEVLELWLIADGTPHSLGVVDPDRPRSMTIPAELRARLGADAALALSLEPPGGSPTGLPTGPVVAQGKLTQI